MFDMRCEEEAAVQPHSRARQEQLQLINNQLREEDDKWQDVSVGQGHGQRGGCPNRGSYPPWSRKSGGWVDRLESQAGGGSP